MIQNLRALSFQPSLRTDEPVPAPASPSPWGEDSVQLGGTPSPGLIPRPIMVAQNGNGGWQTEDDRLHNLCVDITVDRILNSYGLPQGMQFALNNWNQDNPNRIHLLLNSLRGRTDNRSRQAGGMLVDYLADGARPPAPGQSPSALRQSLLGFVRSLPPGDDRRRLAGRLCPSPIDDALRQPPPLQLDLLRPPPRPTGGGWDPSHAGQPPAPPQPDPHVQQFNQAMEALSLAQHPEFRDRVDVSAVRRSLDQLMQQPSVARHVEARQRAALEERLGGHQRAQDLAQQQAAYLAGPAFAQRMELEGEQGTATTMAELRRLHLLNPQLARTTATALLGQTSLGRDMGNVLAGATPQARTAALEHAISSLPDGRRLSDAERREVASAIGNLSREDLSNLLQGTGDVVNRLGNLSRGASNFLRHGGPAGSLVVLGGASILADGHTNLGQLGVATLNSVDQLHNLAGFLLNPRTAATAEAGGRLSTLLRSAGPVAYGIGAFINGQDMMECFAEGNHTSAWLNAGATLCNGALATLGAVGLATSWSPAGWVMLGLAGLGTGLSLLGSALREDPRILMLRRNQWLLPPPPPRIPTLGP